MTTVPSMLEEPGRVDEPQAAEGYAEVLSQVVAAGRPVIVRRNGEDLAAVIPLEHLERVREILSRQEVETLPEERHATARALADDVERWAADEPTSAWSEPFSVKARRWMRRNRTAVATVSVAVLAALIGTAAVLAVLAVQTRANADLKKSNEALNIANAKEIRANLDLTKANEETRAALDQTRRAQKETAAALAQSEESRRQAEAVGNFLVDAFKKPSPWTEGKDVKVTDILAQALTGLEKDFTGSKATEGALLSALGLSFAGLGLYPKAEEAFRKAWAVREAALGPDHRDTLESRNQLAVIYRSAGRTDDAVKLHEATLKLQETKLGPDHPDTLTTRNNLANAYQSLERWADAETLRRDTLARRRRKVDADSPLLAGDLSALGHNLLKQSKGSAAEPILRESLAIRVKAIPDDYRRFNTASLLGGVLLSQGRYAEAEPLIVAGYEGMKARKAKIPLNFNLNEAGERIVQLYRAWGKPEKATEWAARLGLAELPADIFAR
jgi:PHD/YefM family antitoxin component YafN of YafNO toxin-antitoxin module